MFNLDGILIEGNIPTRQRKLIEAWALLHKEELIANWELLKNNEQLFNINPLNQEVIKLRKIVNVKPLEDYKLLLTFDNNVKKIKDMKPYLDKGVFKKLRDESFFNNVTIVMGTISWGDIDMCPDSLYESSEII